MARQSGMFQIEGTIGNLTFEKTRDGYLVKQKTTIKGSRIKTDEAFAWTRENMSEFGRAGKSAKVLRESITSLLKGIKDSKLSARLAKRMMTVVKSDTT